MTKENIFAGVAVVALLLGIWAVFGMNLHTNGSSKFGASAAGNLLAENYIPYVLYNQGYNSAKDLTISGGTTLSGSNLFSGISSFTSTLTVGSSGTALNRFNSGTCNIKTEAPTVTASSSIAVDCGGGALGQTALTGVTVNDRVLVLQSTTTPTIAANAGTGLTILGASASSTAGFITLKLFNGTGTTFTWTAAASSSWQYWVNN